MLQTKFVLFAVVAAMAVGSAVAIIGGQDVRRGKYPYMALLKCYQLKAPFKLHSCGGALISNQWILTAAHCLAPSDGAEVLLDVGNLTEKNELGRVTFNVVKKDYHLHPTYQETQPFINNVALIKLPSAKQHSEYIRPVKFSCTHTPAATDVIAMGFGRVSETFGVFATTLQSTQLKTIDLQQCISNAQHLTYENSLVCANAPQTTVCQDDDGSPLISAKTGQLIGITNHANGICILGSSHAFTRVLPYAQWIEGVIDDYICKKQVKH